MLSSIKHTHTRLHTFAAQPSMDKVFTVNGSHEKSLHVLFSSVISTIHIETQTIFHAVENVVCMYGWFIQYVISPRFESSLQTISHSILFLITIRMNSDEKKKALIKFVCSAKKLHYKPGPFIWFWTFEYALCQSWWPAPLTVYLHLCLERRNKTNEWMKLWHNKRKYTMTKSLSK